MTCDDSCRDIDQEITSKDCIIKCKEDEIKKLNEEIAKLHNNKKYEKARKKSMNIKLE